MHATVALINPKRRIGAPHSSKVLPVSPPNCRCRDEGVEERTHAGTWISCISLSLVYAPIRRVGRSRPRTRLSCTTRQGLLPPPLSPTYVVGQRSRWIQAWKRKLTVSQDHRAKRTHRPNPPPALSRRRYYSPKTAGWREERAGVLRFLLKLLVHSSRASLEGPQGRALEGTCAPEEARAALRRQVKQKN